MDSTMFQLRSFVHQRLYSAAEEIIGQVEKTITLVLREAKEQVNNSLRHQLELLQKKSAEEPLLTGSAVKHGDECDAPIRQENPGPSSPEESNFSTEAPGASQTSTDMENHHWNYCLSETDFKMFTIKEEQEELGASSQTQNLVFPPPEIVKSEQDQTEMQVSYEMHPVALDCPGAQCEDNDEDTELVNIKGTPTKTMKQNLNMSQELSDSDKETSPSALPYDKCSKNEKGRSFCHLCGKGFQEIGPLMKHMQTHKKKTDCTFCGTACRSTKGLISHLKLNHNKTHFCDICGETFTNNCHLRQHERIHTGKAEFICQECGKTFRRRDYLIVHVRTHSGEKPYQCDVCSKAFTQSQHLLIHKRTHSGKKPYPCGICGKYFSTNSQVKIHMRYHLGEKPYACDVCGKCFHESRHMISHKITHTGERPYECPVCGKRYKFAPGLKEHLQIHDTPAAK